MDTEYFSSDILTTDFLNKYKGKQPNWGFNGLGYVTYKRTYARTLADGRTEEWWQTIARCINGAQKIGAKYTKKEAERLYDLIFHLKCNFAGRMLWQLGTPTVDKFGLPSLCNCFSGDTEIITSDGARRISELSGQTVSLMTKYGKWVEAPIKSFGKQKLYKLELSKGKSKKTIFTTANHRWFRKTRRTGDERQTSRNRQCVTTSLIQGDRLISVYGQSVKNINISTFGIAHGIVFGDGSASGKRGQIRLCGDKNKNLLKYFNKSTVYSVNNSEDIIVGDLPSYFKEKPDIKLEKGYLYGWLAGYFAADGNIKESGQIRIASAKKENLEFVRDVCIKLGIGYSTITSQLRKGLGKEDSELFSLELNGADLTSSFFICKEQLKRFLNHSYKPRVDWKVESVEKTDRFEEVYCAVVPETHSFALEGNILTGNCWYVNINDIESFCFTFEHLMLGGGVGFSIKREHIHELPKVQKNVSIKHDLDAQGNPTKDADFIVPDSREGWVSLLRKVLESYFLTGDSFSYSTILIRGAGEPIRGFGGSASGPKYLIEMVDQICKILSTREGKKIRSIDALDICNIIGSCVVAGNVRRSALIAIGDPDDYLYLRAKRWDLGNIPNWRSMSNNSIYCDSYDHIMENVWDGYAGNGEPYGFINIGLAKKYGRLGEKVKDNCDGMNPCQPYSAPVLTKNGIRQMGEIEVGDEIWSETGWTTVIKKWSNGIKKTYKYNTTAGYFYGTENHKLVSNSQKVEAKYCESIDILSGSYSPNILLDPRDVMDGLVIGDGSVHKASSNKVYLCIGEDDQDYFKSEVKDLILDKNLISGNYSFFDIETTIESNELTYTFDREIPNRFLYGNKSKICGFLRGLYSANGSICGNRITLKASSKKIIEQVQLMLSSVGIKSYYTTNKSSSVKFKNGEFLCKESYDLNISIDRDKFYESIGFIQSYKINALVNLLKSIKKASEPAKNTYDIKSIDFVREEEVFDITVDNDSHTYWTGGCNVSNCAEATLEHAEPCDLSELYLNKIESKDELFICAKLLYKTQKAILTLPSISKATEEVVRRNMRIGLGVTGICQSVEKLEWLDECYLKLREYDKEWSKERDWVESIKLTVVKPSGTLSILAGSTSGVHPAFSKYFIRRIRMASNDPLVKACQDLGYKTEYVKNFDGSYNHDTIVIEFPCQFENDTIFAENMKAVEQLEMVKRIQTIWADQAVSCTVYYRKEELSEIKEWLRKNYKKGLKSVSFLLHSEHGFDQAPYEEITEKKYLSMVKKVKPLTDIKIESGAAIDGIECESGACPVK